MKVERESDKDLGEDVLFYPKSLFLKLINNYIHERKT